MDVSVVVPVYNCAPCLRRLHERLTSTLDPLRLRYELIFVDDGSADEGWAVLEELAADDTQTVLVKLSRNFGQHPAITAGLERAQGTWTVVMDCDLQHPPEEIPRLLETARSGYDVVLTRRAAGGHSRFRRSASSAYFRLMNAVLKTRVGSDFSNFSVISAPVRQAFLRIRDQDRQYLMIVHWLGFRRTTVEFEPAERFAGTSSYSLLGLVRFALAGLFFQTTTLLHWIVYFGFAVSAAGGLLALFFVFNYFGGSPYPGWTSLGVLLLLLCGFIIAVIGVTGLYVGRIFNQVKDRPLYVVEREVRGGGRPC